METCNTPPKSPSGFDAFLTVPAHSFGGSRTLPIRSRAFRQWFFDQSLSDYETIPTAHAFNAILHHLDALAARDPHSTNVRVPFRIDSRGLSPTPQKILLDLANPEGQFVEITPDGWQVGVSASPPKSPIPSAASPAASASPTTSRDSPGAARDPN